MIPKYRTALAEVATELRAGKHPEFDVSSVYYCVNSILSKKFRESWIETRYQSDDPQEQKQLRYLYRVHHHPNEPEGDDPWERDPLIHADRIDRFLATGSCV